MRHIQYYAAVDVADIANRVEELLEELMAHQRRRITRVAESLRPNLTADDLLQPHDHPELRNDASFNYEDGILAGIISVQMALRSRIWIPTLDGSGDSGPDGMATNSEAPADDGS